MKKLTFLILVIFAMGCSEKETTTPKPPTPTTKCTTCTEQQTQIKTTGMEAAQPEWEWFENLLFQSRKSNTKVYFKPNLTVRPVEYPL